MTLLLGPTTAIFILMSQYYYNIFEKKCIKKRKNKYLFIKMK